jgi:hypothetical protein
MPEVSVTVFRARDRSGILLPGTGCWAKDTGNIRKPQLGSQMFHGKPGPAAGRMRPNFEKIFPEVLSFWG